MVDLITDKLQIFWKLSQIYSSSVTNLTSVDRLCDINVSSNFLETNGSNFFFFVNFSKPTSTFLILILLRFLIVEQIKFYFVFQSSLHSVFRQGTSENFLRHRSRKLSQFRPLLFHELVYVFSANAYKYNQCFIMADIKCVSTWCLAWISFTEIQRTVREMATYHFISSHASVIFITKNSKVSGILFLDVVRLNLQSSTY